MAGVRGLAYSAVSTQDWVPQVPFTLEGLEAINRPNPLAAFPNGCAEVSTVPSPPQVQIGFWARPASTPFSINSWTLFSRH